MAQNFRTAPLKLSSNSSSPNRVQVLRTGLFNSPEYGEFEITKEHLLSMKQNFDAKVRGVDLAIDYAHDSHLEAAAWITGLELSADNQELWAIVDWTPQGEQTIKSKEYRYLSADFNYQYIDNESGKDFGCTLMGAGLTNRPFVKEMQPVIQLAEGSQPKPSKPKGEIKMEEKDQKIAELEKTIADLKAQMDSGSADMANLQKKCAEFEESAKQAEAAKVLAEKAAKFDKLLNEGKLCAAQKDAFIAGDAMKLAELAEPVNLTSHGHGATNTGAPEAKDAKEAAKKLIQLSQLAVKEGRARDERSAMLLVRKENPELVQKTDHKFS